MATRSVVVRLRADTSQFNRAMLSAGAAAKSFANNLDDADARMANLVQTGLALGPALVPMAAGATAGVVALGSAIGAAATAGGVAIAAFQGIGDSVKALNEYGLDPTAENLEKVRQTMAELAPAGQEFAQFIQGDVMDSLEDLQRVAQEGMLPGVQEGISQVLGQLPLLEDIVTRVSLAMGDMGEAAGGALSGPFWTEFLEFIRDDSASALKGMGEGFGNIAEGVAGVVMAMDPLGDSMGGALLSASEAFAQWGQSLGDSEGFAEFVQYVRDNGPQAAETLGAIGNAVLQFVEAAAPVGAVVLPVMEGLADVLAAIADSPAGPLLVSTAAAVGTLGRSLALLKTVGLRGDGGGVISSALGMDALKKAPEAFRSVTAASQDLAIAERDRAAAAIKARDTQFAMVPDAEKRAAVRDYTTALSNQEAAEKRLREAERGRSAAIRSSLGSMGKAAGVVGGLAVATSGLGEDMGVTNTAMLGLMGSMLGPWGVAAGAVVGASMDAAAANNAFYDSLAQLEDVLATSPESLRAQSLGLRDVRDEFMALKENTDGESGFWDLGEQLATAKNNLEGLFGKSDVEEGAEQLAEAKKQVVELRDGFAQMGQAVSGGTFNAATAGLAEIERAATTIVPALRQAGYSTEEIKRTLSEGPEGAGWGEAARAVREYVRETDSVASRTDNVADAFAGLDDQLSSTADKANALANALDALLGPELKQDEALTAWRRELSTLTKELKQNKATLNVNTKAGQDNRDAIRGRVEALTASIKADAEAGVGADRLAQKLRNGRGAIIAAGQAAGFSAGEMRGYLKQLGLTPKLVQTVIEAVGVTGAIGSVDRLRSAIAALQDKSITVTTYLREIRLNVAANQSSVPGVETRGIQEANGGVVDYYAGGGIRENHVAQIAPAGAWRVWAEPETGGEAYIPLAPAKRDRSLDIWQETGRRLGAVGFADGGFASLSNREEEARERRQEERQERREKRQAQHEREIARTERELDKARAELDKARERAQAVRSGLRAFGPADTAGDMRSEVKDLRRTLREALGKDSPVLDKIDALGERMVKVAGAMARNTREQEKLSDRIEDLRDARRDLEQSVAGNFRNDPFAAGINTFDFQVAEDTTDATTMDRALQRAKRKGLSGALYRGLAESGNFLLAQEFAGMSRREIAQRERALAARNAASSGLAGRVGATVYGAEQREANKEMRGLTREMEKLRDRIGTLDDKVTLNVQVPQTASARDVVDGIAYELRKQKRGGKRG